jgi:serine/tyrosine/threonine adenylyltransferase
MTVPPIVFDNSYARLPDVFHAKLPPTPVAKPTLLRVNVDLARELGIDPHWLAGDAGIATVAGNALPPGAEPLAMAYSGHQFGHWSGQLGDGRAILLGETIGRDGKRYDIHLKGSGRTPFSRGGDGRAAIGPVLRELVVSEAMHRLGVPTTRVLSAVATGETVLRQDGPMPGAVLARVARGHVRVGTFEHFASRDDREALIMLTDYAIARFDPELMALGPGRELALLDAVIARTARLIAQWQCLGFIHGVMNTDNVTISGETIDYGPCAFMDTYDPDAVFSSIDHGGRYRYSNQPRIGHWNMARFAQCLLAIVEGDGKIALDAAQKSLDAFPVKFEQAWLAGMRRKLGLLTEEDGDRELIGSFLSLTAETKSDFTNTFRLLCDDLTLDGFADWRAAWLERRAREAALQEAQRVAMLGANPAFIPRNHRVEAALAAAQHGNLAPFDELMDVLKAPYDDRPEYADYKAPPAEHEIVRATFCGT